MPVSDGERRGRADRGDAVRMRYTKRDENGAYIDVQDGEYKKYVEYSAVLKQDGEYIYRVRGEAIERFAALEDEHGRGE